ncbi:MAG: Type IV pilus biogenesis protein PilM [Parcubacteria group bacterium GW2011_GWA2_33_14]|uniref:SHS2 domain-containing protein n=1 Tax=Candidatus Staskawiczbacteria bacterium RIFCSPHIGHO2_02_FULL_33_16 TaxID=1802204 RepID=A0A1G2I034_9BACT|nr:MAG: Type IV pilus biogenesis protein PilM [Parcubacteria group bacterium GW2011_GWA2_33_14]OGZ67438.1 MAG: hypothetical protein A3D34_02240 [Candidatus Staskawiczbacteria bacterium RIFCSPHIGHO2_02_FULL_33_16]OGZ70965.1 MAG: hypothetical protein A2980_03085 [Candidatus Staskawiczbacteria bacterium RIFCSPLOWO2_01_FULL_33_13]
MKNIFKNPFKIFFPKKMVGIDIGTSAIKVVELSRWGKGNTLENYGQIQSSLIYKQQSSNYEKSSSLLSKEFVSRAIRGILEESHIKTKEVIFSIPDFFTFCTSFEIPPMPEKEIPGAVRYNASQYITLPISEVTLDWKIIARHPGDKKSALKIFLVAIPNQVIKEYQEIASMSGLDLYALEAEAFGITRALVKSNNKKTICIMDVGVQSSTVNIIDGGFLQRSYSFNFYSNKLSKSISTALGIEYDKAEEIKIKEGILSSRPGVAETLYLLINPLLMEIKTISAEFFQSEQKQVEEIYLTGGAANLPGLKEYFAESLKKNTSLPNCFSDFLYPPILEETLKDMSPSFAAAVGVALGGLEI